MPKRTARPGAAQRIERVAQWFALNERRNYVGQPQRTSGRQYRTTRRGW